MSDVLPSGMYQALLNVSIDEDWDTDKPDKENMWAKCDVFLLITAPSQYAMRIVRAKMTFEHVCLKLDNPDSTNWSFFENWPDIEDEPVKVFLIRCDKEGFMKEDGECNKIRKIFLNDFDTICEW